MKTYFSSSLNSFLLEGLNVLPPDAIQISNELHRSLLEGQAQGMVITSDENGYPVLIPAPRPEVSTLTAPQFKLYLESRGEFTAFNEHIAALLGDPEHPNDIYIRWTSYPNFSITGMIAAELKTFFNLSQAELQAWYNNAASANPTPMGGLHD